MSKNDKLDEVIRLVEDLHKIRKDYSSIHKQEHEYLRVLIAEHKRKEETWNVIYQRLASRTIWSLIIAVFAAVALSLNSWLDGGL